MIISANQSLGRMLRFCGFDGHAGGDSVGTLNRLTANVVISVIMKAIRQ